MAHSLSNLLDTLNGQKGPLYLVGQSHPNFAGGGIKSYEQLTEVLE